MDAFEVISIEAAAKSERWLAKHYRVTAIIVALVVNALCETMIHELEAKGVDGTLAIFETHPVMQPAIYHLDTYVGAIQL